MLIVWKDASSKVPSVETGSLRDMEPAITFLTPDRWLAERYQPLRALEGNDLSHHYVEYGGSGAAPLDAADCGCFVHGEVDM